MDGRVAAIFPVWNRLRAGVCVGLKVYIDLMTQISSITDAMLGRRLETYTPSPPYCLNSTGDGSRPPVVRSVRSSTDEGRCPWYFESDGLGSNMSSCDGPPTMNSTMLCFAFGGKLGNFGAATTFATFGAGAA